MQRVMKKKDLIDELSSRTGFYKKNMEQIVNALSDVIIEHFSTAEFGEDSELHLAPGVVLCGERKPEGETINPKTQLMAISPERVVPYAVFKQSVRQKLYKVSKPNKKNTKKR